MPNTLPSFNATEFRQRLVGLADPSKLPSSEAITENLKQEAKAFCLVMAELFGEELERTTLWARIGTAIETAGAKCGQELDRFVCHCLEHIQADTAKAVANERYIQWISAASSRPPEWQAAFLHYIVDRRLIVLVFARQAWEQVKAERKAAKGGDK